MRAPNWLAWIRHCLLASGVIVFETGSCRGSGPRLEIDLGNFTAPWRIPEVHAACSRNVCKVILDPSDIARLEFIDEGKNLRQSSESGPARQARLRSIPEALVLGRPMRRPSLRKCRRCRVRKICTLDLQSVCLATLGIKCS